jgi:subtilisin-like proprotein convertase family protein
MNLVSGASGPSQAPLIRTSTLDSGFLSPSTFIKSSSFPIRNNTSKSDSIMVSSIGSAYRVTAFVLLNHSSMDDVDLALRAPNGMSINLSTDNGGVFNDLMTVFDDNADSIVNDFCSPYSMRVRPQTPLSTIQSSTPNGYWRLTVADDNAAIVDSGFVHAWGVKFSPITGAVTNSNIPGTFRLYQNYPNPFNPVTKIKFDIPLAPLSPLEGGTGGKPRGSVSLKVYDVSGREVTTLVSDILNPGSYEIEWDASNNPSGVYFYRLHAGVHNETRKMILLK